MKQKIKILLVLLCIGVAVMIALDGLSSWKTRVSGAFVRSYPPHFLKAGRSINLGVNSYYFAGADGSDIMLGNYSNPRVLFKVGEATLDTATIALVFPAQYPPSLAARVAVLGDTAVVTDGPQGLIMHGRYSEFKMANVDTLGAYDFNQACVLSGQTIGLRGYDGTLHQNTLRLYHGNTKIVTPRSSLLTKQVDGVFCTEGKLLRVEDSFLFVYVYSFRNQYLVLDSNMMLQFQSHTLDTNYMAKIKVQILDGGARTTMAAPPLVVNRLAATAGNHLIILSGILADNDAGGALKDYGIADVYNLSNGRYEASFYLPKQGHNRLSDIWAYHGILYAMEDEYLYSFQLPALFENK